MKLLKSNNQKGQSMIEMAITAPILLIFLLGIFEVGAAVRNYLTLVNVNREITRFAVRPGYLDFSTVDSVGESYGTVRDWALSAAGDQIELDFTNTGDVNNTGSTTLIVSHFVIETNLPCEDIASNPGGCDCDLLGASDYRDAFTQDDIIVHPGMSGQGYQMERFGPPETVTGVRDTRLDYEALISELASRNNQFNCEIIKKGGVPSNNNVVVTELFVDQPQLFGFPFISNPYTDPVPLYTHTSMRLINGARGYTLENIGPLCMAYPITFQEEVFDDPDNPTPNQPIDAFEGDTSGTFGWITWNPASGNNNANYVEDELRYPQMSRNDFIDVNDSDDTNLSIGDDVSTKPGVANSSGIDDLLQALEGREIIVPVYDINPGTGDGAYYHITHFARIRVDNICLPANSGDASCGGPPGSKLIEATFIEYVDDLCGADDS